MNKLAYYLFGLKLPLLLNYSAPAILLYPLFSKLFKSNYFRFLVFVFIPSLIVIRLIRNDSFFLSDDFDHLYLAFRYSYLDIVKLAATGQGIWVGNRIILGFWLFEAIYNLFGARTEAFLIAMYLFHMANVFLFWLIVKRFVKSLLPSVFSTLVVSSYYLTWIANIHEVVGATFVLLSVYYFLKWLAKETTVYASLGFYLLAILTKEIAFLLPLVLIFLGVYYHFNIKKVDSKKIFKKLLIFLVILFIYLLTYAFSFLVYFNLPGVDSYKMGLSLLGIIHNLLYYLTYNFPIINYSYWGLILFIFLGLYDFLVKKPRMTPFLVSYLVFLSPVLLFIDRHTFYYAYIPTFFLFLGLAILLADLHSLALKFLKGKPRLYHRIFNVYAILLLAVVVFRLDRLLLENTFLIQFPHPGNLKGVVLSVASRAEECYREQEEKCEIELSGDDYEKVDFPVRSGSLNSFLPRDISTKVIFSLNPEKTAVLVEKK